MFSMDISSKENLRLPLASWRGAPQPRYVDFLGSLSFCQVRKGWKIRSHPSNKSRGFVCFFIEGSDDISGQFRIPGCYKTNMDMETCHV